MHTTQQYSVSISLNLYDDHRLQFANFSFSVENNEYVFAALQSQNRLNNKH